MEIVNFLYLAAFYMMANVVFFLFIRLPLAVKLASIENHGGTVSQIDTTPCQIVNVGQGTKTELTTTLILSSLYFAHFS